MTNLQTIIATILINQLPEQLRKEIQDTPTGPIHRKTINRMIGTGGTAETICEVISKTFQIEDSSDLLGYIESTLIKKRMKELLDIIHRAVSGEVVAFIKAQSLLNLTDLEKACGMPPTTLYQATGKGRHIPFKYIASLIMILKDYGLGW